VVDILLGILVFRELYSYSHNSSFGFLFNTEEEE